MPTDRSQPRPRRQEACSSEGCASDIGRIVQHAADRGCMPICRALRGPTAHLLQTAAYCAQAQSIQTDPCKDASNDVRLRFHHLETRHSAALTPAHVAVRHVGGRAVRAPEFWLVHIRRSRLEPGARDHPPRCRRSDGSGKQSPRPRGETHRSAALDGRNGGRVGAERGHRCARYGRQQLHPAGAPAPGEIRSPHYSLHPRSCDPVRVESRRQRSAPVAQ